MAVNLSFIGGAGWQFFDNNGVPLSGGKLYTYAAGTTTPVATYTSRTGIIPNTNPIILDSAGRTPEQIWSTEGILYKYVVQTSAGVLIRTWDNIGGSVVASDFAQDLASTSDNAKGDALVGFKQSNSAGFITGAAARTVNAKLQETISAADFGAVGDGATNDTTAFSLFETGTKGQSVDLLGLIYLVNAVPNGNDYYNGAFKVGTNVYWLFSNPKQHPFDTTTNSVSALLPVKNQYRTIQGIYGNSDGKSMTVLFSQQQNHGVDVNKKLFSYQSTDYGRTKTFGTQYNLAYADDTYSWGTSASGLMGSGRFGLITGRVTVLGVDGPPAFVYSDNNGQTWTSSILSYGASGLTRSYFHSGIYNWPSSVGGNDTSGWIAYAYVPGSGIAAWKTLNNGASWSVSLVVPNVAGINLSECSVARIGDLNQWVMVGRTGANNAFACVSSDMLTWSTAQYIPNLNLRGNPPELIYDDGRLYFFGFSREGSKEIQTQVNNALLVSAGNPATVYSSAGVSGWGNWKLVTNLSFWPTGYIHPIKLQNRWFFYFTGGEELAGGSTGRTGIMYLLSNDIAEATPTTQELNLFSGTNFLLSGQCNYWPAGTSFTSSGARQQVLPGVTFARNGGASTSTFLQVPGDEAVYAFRMRRQDGDTATNTVNLCISLTSEDSYVFRNNRINISFNARCGTGFSGFDPSSVSNKWLYVRARSSTNPQQVVTSLSATPAGDTVVATSNSGVYLNPNWCPYTISTGPLDETANQLFIQIFWTPTGTALEDWVEIENLMISVGTYATPFKFESLQTVVNWANQFYQTKTVQTENGSRNIPLARMCRVPTVTTTAGTAASVTSDGFELSNTAAATTTIVAQGFL
jgi:hypothetical protein